LQQRRVGLQPQANRQAKTVLGLGDDFVRQKSAQRLLEKIAQTRTFEFQPVCEAGGKFHQGVVEHRKTHIDPR